MDCVIRKEIDCAKIQKNGEWQTANGSRKGQRRIANGEWAGLGDVSEIFD